jgi:hypothetical protein
VDVHVEVERVATGARLPLAFDPAIKSICLEQSMGWIKLMVDLTSAARTGDETEWHDLRGLKTPESRHFCMHIILSYRTSVGDKNGRHALSSATPSPVCYEQSYAV